MNLEVIVTVILSVLSSSFVTLVLSAYIIEPLRDRKKYIFDEKKRVYESIIIFAQIVLFPKESKYAVGVARYDIQSLSDEQNMENALNNLKMALPKIMLITQNTKVSEDIKLFIQYRSEHTFNKLVNTLQKDLYK